MIFSWLAPESTTVNGAEVPLTAVPPSFHVALITRTPVLFACTGFVVHVATPPENALLTKGPAVSPPLIAALTVPLFWPSNVFPNRSTTVTARLLGNAVPAVATAGSSGGCWLLSVVKDRLS